MWPIIPMIIPVFHFWGMLITILQWPSLAALL
jgi:hypothetical protein